MKISISWYVSAALLNAFLNWLIFFNLEIFQPLLIAGLITFVILAIMLYFDRFSSAQNKITKAVIYLALSVLLPLLGFYIFLKWISGGGSWVPKGL